MRATMVHDDAASVLRARLEARLEELQAKVASTLVPEPDAAAGAGEVRDAVDESVVVEHTDVRTALLQRDARELHHRSGRVEELRHPVHPHDGGRGHVLAGLDHVE